MKEQNILKHFAVIGAGTFINLLLGLLTTPIITRIVDPTEYGQLSIFTTYAGIAMIVLCCGLDQSLMRYYYEQKSIDAKRALLKSCLLFPVLFSILGGGALFALVYFDIIQFDFNPLITALFGVFILIQIIYRFSILTVRLEYKSNVYSILNIAHKAIYILVALALIFIVRSHYLLLLVIATIAAELLCALAAVFVQRETWNFSHVSRKISSASMKELVQYGAPFIITLGITSVFQALDKMSLNKYCTFSEVGVYASACTLINLFAIVQIAFNSLWSPMALKHYNEDKEDRTFYQKGNQLITVVMFFIGLCVILCKDLFALLLGEKYREAAMIVPMLAFYPIMYTVSETTVSGLVFMKKSKLQIWVALAACVTNFIGNTLLVPHIGGKGAAISTGVSYIVYFTLRTILSMRCFYVDYRLKAFYLLTVAVAAYALYNTFVPFNAGTIIGFLICVVLMIVLYWEHIKWGLGYVKKSILKL